VYVCVSVHVHMHVVVKEREGMHARLCCRHCAKLSYIRGYFVVQCGAVWCSVLQCVAVCCSVLQCAGAQATPNFRMATTSKLPKLLYNTLQHTATHCGAMVWQPRVGSLNNTLQNIATHCNTLQHTATHCNTLQHTADLWSGIDEYAPEFNRSVLQMR